MVLDMNMKILVDLQVNVHIHMKSLLGDYFAPAFAAIVIAYGALVAWSGYAALKVTIVYTLITSAIGFTLGLGTQIARLDDGQPGGPSAAEVAGATMRAMTGDPPKIKVKQVEGTMVCSDMGSGANDNLTCYGYVEPGWLMLGHGLNTSTIKVVKHDAPAVTRATGWEEVWNDAGSRKGKDYSIWRPVHKDKGTYFPLGVFCSFGIKGHVAPDINNVGMVHRDYIEVTNLGKEIWKDKGTGAKEDVTLKAVPGLTTGWPSVSRLGPKNAAHTLKPDSMQDA